MRALAIIGSPNPKGSTAYLVGKIAQGLREKGVDTVEYCLGEQKINFCLGCKECYKEGKCIQHDDMDKIISDFKEADILIIGTPDYWGYVSGQLKVFFDRNTPYANTNEKRIPMLRERFGVSVSVREGGSDRENIEIVKAIEHYFGHMEVKPIGSVKVTRVSTLSDLLRDHQDKINEAYELGKNIPDLIEKKEL